ncbi:MAG: hypothetical protein ABW104_13795 [Candidatus Thiodiazotropha sp. 6PLUC2]
MTMKYIADLDPDRPRDESYVIEGIEDITNIKKALLASFGGFVGPVLVTATMDEPGSSPQKFKLVMPLVKQGIFQGVDFPEVKDNTIIVFKSILNNEEGVKVVLGADCNCNVYDSRGEPIEANAIRKDSIYMLIYLSNTLFLLGYQNSTEKKIPEPAQKNKNKILSNDGTAFIWTEGADPTKELPDFRGQAGKMLTVDRSESLTWGDQPKGLPALRETKGSIGKVLMAVKGTGDDRTPDAAWRRLEKALPDMRGKLGHILHVGGDEANQELEWTNVPVLPPIAGKKDMALHVVETVSTGQLKPAWKSVPEVLPAIDGQEGKALMVTNNSKVAWENVAGELPELEDHLGDYLSVVEVNTDALGVGWKTPTKELPDFRGQAGKMLTVDRSESLTWGDQPKGLPEIEGSDEGKVLMVFGKKEVWKNLPPIPQPPSQPTQGLPEIKDGDEGKVLTVSSDQKEVWKNLPPIPQPPSQPTQGLPEIKDGDEGKVLTVFGKKEVWKNLPPIPQPPSQPTQGLPEIKDGDEGKVLTVSSDQKEVWQNVPPIPLPPSLALNFF